MPRFVRETLKSIREARLAKDNGHTADLQKNDLSTLQGQRNPRTLYRHPPATDIPKDIPSTSPYYIDYKARSKRYWDYINAPLKVKPRHGQQITLNGQRKYLKSQDHRRALVLHGVSTNIVGHGITGGRSLNSTSYNKQSRKGRNYKPIGPNKYIVDRDGDVHIGRKRKATSNALLAETLQKQQKYNAKIANNDLDYRDFPAARAAPARAAQPIAIPPPPPPRQRGPPNRYVPGRI